MCIFERTKGFTISNKIIRENICQLYSSTPSTEFSKAHGRDEKLKRWEQSQQQQEEDHQQQPDEAAAGGDEQRHQFS
jgi:hypothetical protein